MMSQTFSHLKATEPDWQIPTLSPLPPPSLHTSSSSPVKSGPSSSTNRYSDPVIADDSASSVFSTARSVATVDNNGDVILPGQINTATAYSLMKSAGFQSASGSCSSLRVNVSSSVTPDVPRGPCSSHGNFTLEYPARDNGTSFLQKEEQFFDEFFLSCGEQWPVSYDRIMEACKSCSSMDVHAVLYVISLRFGFSTNKTESKQNDSTCKLNCDCNSSPAMVNGSQINSSRENRAINATCHSQNENNEGDKTTCGTPHTHHAEDNGVINAACKLPFHQQMSLLTLVELGLHDDVFPVPLVAATLHETLTALQSTQRDSGEQSTVATRAKRLKLVLSRLEKLWETRSA